MVNGAPLFKGSSEENQLEIIFKNLGTPSELIYNNIIDSSNSSINLSNFQFYPTPPSLQFLVPKLDSDGVNLLESFLTYDPAQRITAQDARSHPFFNSIPESLRNIGSDMS